MAMKFEKNTSRTSDEVAAEALTNKDRPVHVLSFDKFNSDRDAANAERGEKTLDLTKVNLEGGDGPDDMPEKDLSTENVEGGPLQPVLPYGVHTLEEIQDSVMGGTSEKAREMHKLMSQNLEKLFKQNKFKFEGDKTLRWAFKYIKSKEVHLKKGTYFNSGWNPKTKQIETFTGDDWEGFAYVFEWTTEDGITLETIVFKQNCANPLDEVETNNNTTPATVGSTSGKEAPPDLETGPQNLRAKISEQHTYKLLGARGSGDQEFSFMIVDTDKSSVEKSFGPFYYMQSPVDGTMIPITKDLFDSRRTKGELRTDDVQSTGYTSADNDNPIVPAVQGSKRPIGGARLIGWLEDTFVNGIGK